MKVIIFSLLILGAFSSFLPKPTIGEAVALPSKQNLIDFIIGNLIAVKITESVPDGFGCATTITNLQNATQTALALIRSGSLDNIVEGVELLEQAINDTQRVCGSASEEGQETFQSFLEKIKDPGFITLALGRIKDNFLTILQDFEKASDDLKNQSFFSAGYDLGSIVHLILSGPDSSLVSYISEEITRLGAVNWPFTTCTSDGAIQLSSLTLDAQPSKGNLEGINLVGTSNNAVSLKQVQITTLLNGTPLNTQYDANTKSYQAGDDFSYRFAITIPGFAPSVLFFIFINLIIFIYL